MQELQQKHQKDFDTKIIFNTQKDNNDFLLPHEKKSYLKKKKALRTAILTTVYRKI